MSLPGTGVEVCGCGQHKSRCKFGQMHGWSLAFVNPATGVPLEVPCYHCHQCHAWCPLEDEELAELQARMAAKR